MNGSTGGIFNRFHYYDKRARLVDDEVYPLTDSFGTGTVTISGAENTCVSGSGSSCVAEAGTLSVTAGNTATVAFGANSTVQSIATAIATWFNQTPGVVVTAAVANNGPNCSSGTTMSLPALPCAVLTFTAIQFGMYGDYPLAAPVPVSTNSSSASFFTQASGTALCCGVGSPQSRAAYATGIAYSLNGNITAVSDPFNGSWNYTYDTLNRLTSGTSTAYDGVGVTTPSGTFNYQCWAYDSFGNKTYELDSNSACPVSLTNANSTHHVTYGASNRISSSDTGAVIYDAAGNVIQDALNKYVYDNEGRLCAVENLLTTAGTQYVYDATGRRVAKGTLTTFPGTGNACVAPTAANGFTLTAVYLLGTGGEQQTELDSNLAWHTNAYANGDLLATYSGINNGAGTAPTLSFSFANWEGTKRMEATSTGQLSMWWSSDPFGDYLHASGTGFDVTEQHFTGKERDAESGNDYFEARYYSSTMGRFLSPDWSSQEDSVPYSNLANPQSLNLYSYVRNNPLALSDPDGHDSDDDDDPNQSQDQKQMTATVYSEQSHAEPAQQEATASTILNRANSGQSQFVKPGEDVNLHNVLNSGQFQGVQANQPYADYMNGILNALEKPGANSAFAAVANVLRNGPTTEAEWFIITARPLSPKELKRQQKALGKVQPAQIQRIVGKDGSVLYLYRPAPKPKPRPKPHPRSKPKKSAGN